MTSYTVKNLSFKITIAIVSLVMLIWLAQQFVSSYDEQQKQHSSIDKGLMLHNEQLGWKLAENWQGRHHHYDYKTEYTTTASGFRQSPTALTDTKLLILGDSLAFGYGVADNETFSYVLSQLSGITSTNAAIPGFSTDQQLLLLQQLLPQLPALQTVIIAVNLSDDLLDNALPQPLNVGQLKPFYTLSKEQQLSLNNSPVPAKIVRPLPNDMIDIAYGELLRPYLTPWLRLLGLFGITTEQSKIPSEPAVLQQRLASTLATQRALLKALLEQIDAMTNNHHSKLLMLALPSQSFYNSDKPAQQQLEQHSLTVLENLSRDLNIPLLNSSTQLTSEDFYPHDGHLKATAHHRIAELLQQELSP